MASDTAAVSNRPYGRINETWCANPTIEFGETLIDEKHKDKVVRNKKTYNFSVANKPGNRKIPEQRATTNKGHSFIDKWLLNCACSKNMCLHKKIVTQAQQPSKCSQGRLSNYIEILIFLT